MDARAWAQQLFPGEVQDFAGLALGKFHNLLAGIERGATLGLGLADVMDYATQRPMELGYADEHRGQADALRHILLAAELRRLHPWLAGPLLYGHEFVTNTLQGQPAEEREQDVENNAIGLQLGQLSRSRADTERMALNALPKAKVLKSDYYRNY